jgi:endonuclease/exonuclease/phosphatase family metal-dependent hydrolase
MKTFMNRRATGAGAWLCSYLLLCASVHGQLDVTNNGGFAPPGGGTYSIPGLPNPFPIPLMPYVLVKSALMNSTGSSISVEAGEYRESGVFTAGSDLVLGASGGDVVLGNQDSGNSTTFSLVTLNTHLIGDEEDQPFTPDEWSLWNDPPRAKRIAEICAAEQWDFVALQEVWDEDYFSDDPEVCVGCDTDNEVTHPIFEHSGYAYGEVGTAYDGSDPMHSGLAVMSLNEEISGFSQYSFVACGGWDCWANKGFVWSTINKDGFNIHIINTHMQADADEFDDRALQVQEMGAVIDFHRTQFPNDVYFIVGDINIGGEGWEYYVTMLSHLGGSFRDAARHSPGFTHNDHITNSQHNEFAFCYDCETVNNRFDYILYTPASDNGSVRVTPRMTEVYKFLGPTLSGPCPDCDGDDAPSIITNEMSDHWGVEGEFEIYSS